jgi:LysM repeat protein
MSETAPERSGGRENVFTHKIGPLPMWAWVAILGGLIIAWSIYSRNKAGSSASTSTGATGTSASDIPQFVNQTYTTVQAPAAPTDTDTTPAPAGTPVTIKPPVVSTPHPRNAPPPAHASQPPIFNKTITVGKGQTLDSIAKQYKITRVELAHANGLGTGAGLRTGQTLKVPSPAPGGTPNKAL